MKVFRNKEEIIQALRDISSIDYRERAKVLEKMKEELDHGGVSRQEFRDVVRDLKSEYHISDVDVKNLLDLIK